MGKERTVYKNERNERHAFVNPYNFIPLGEKAIRSVQTSDQDQKDLHTGYFVCELENKTPLAIPDTSEKTEDKEKKQHYKYMAYRMDGKLTIPGSSLRGVLRSTYEVFTNSCMVTMDPAEILTARSQSNEAMSPCVLKKENGQWKLYRAKRVALVGRSVDGKTKYAYPPKKYNEEKSIYHRFGIMVASENSPRGMQEGEKYLVDDKGRLIARYGDEVAITEGPAYEKEDQKTKRSRKIWSSSVKTIYAKKGTGAYLYLGEFISKKHAESVFVIDKQPTNWSDEDIKKALKKLGKTIEMYRDNAVNRNLESKDKSKENEIHFGYPGYEYALKNVEEGVGGLPLWYNERKNSEDEKLRLSMASIGRYGYNATMGDISKDYKPCMDRKCLCPACAVFGMIAKGSEQKGKGSQVRITDAVLLGEEHTDQVTLRELGTPRTSYLPFYSEDGKNYDEEGATIRGRKFYWHIPLAAKDRECYQDSNKTKRNGTFEVIGTNSCFQFRVYYDSLTQEQLDMLTWTLNLGGNDSSKMFKLGHGKPLGLGSVKIKISEQVERSYDEAGGYQITSYQANGNQRWEKEQGRLLPNLLVQEARKYLTVFEFHENENTKICYPYVYGENGVSYKSADNEDKNELANHQWFKKFNSKNPELPKNMSVAILPDAADAMNTKLHAYRMEKIKSN